MHNLDEIKKPSSFSFNNPQRCQSRCITCNAWETPSSVMENELTTQEWKDIIQKIHNWVGDYAFIFSGGEPLLRDDIFEIAQFAKSIGVTPDIITNGLALSNKELLEKLVRSDFRTVTFSLNAIENPRLHIESRGREDSFKKTVDAIQNFNYLNKKLNMGKWISLSMVVMPSNLSEIKPMAEFAKSEGIGICYQLLDNGDAFIPPPEAMLPSGGFSCEITDKALDAINLMVELKKQGFPIYNGDPQLEAFKTLVTNPSDISNLVCQVGYNNFSIDPYGYVRICFCFDHIGNLRDELPEKLWVNEKAFDLRNKIASCTRKCKLLNCNFKE